MRASSSVRGITDALLPPTVRRMRRFLVLLALAALAGTAAAASALAGDAPQPVRSGGVSGLVPSRLSAQAGGFGDLSYHGDRVMRTNKVYAIYWQPPGFSTSAGYQTLISG